jgi:hypothetical protein
VAAAFAQKYRLLVEEHNPPGPLSGEISKALPAYYVTLRKSPFIGPKGGLYEDPQHKRPWNPNKKVKPSSCPRCKGAAHVISRQAKIGGGSDVSSAPCRTCNPKGKIPLDPKKVKAAGLPMPAPSSRASKRAPPENKQPATARQMGLEFHRPVQASLFKAWKLEGELEFQGLDVAIENKVGSKRQWGKKPEEHTVMVHPYGYIRGVVGADGDELDVYVGPHDDSEVVFVVNQRRIGDKRKFDEHKVMLGFRTLKEAREGYLKHYKPRQLGEALVGSIRTWSMERFKRWLETKGAKMKPLRKGEP